MKLSPELAAACLKLAGAPPAPRSSRRPPKVPAALATPWALSFTVPVRVASRANRRDHWADAHRRNRLEAAALAAELLRLGLTGAGASLPRPLAVRLTRLHRGRPMDDDNLGSAHKNLRDRLAEWLELDDGSPLVRWSYSQQKAPDAACRVGVSSLTTEGV